MYFMRCTVFCIVARANVAGIGPLQGCLEYVINVIKLLTNLRDIKQELLGWHSWVGKRLKNDEIYRTKPWMPHVKGV